MNKFDYRQKKSRSRAIPFDTFLKVLSFFKRDSARECRVHAWSTPNAFGGQLVSALDMTKIGNGKIHIDLENDSKLVKLAMKDFYLYNMHYEFPVQYKNKMKEDRQL